MRWGITEGAAGRDRPYERGLPVMTDRPEPVRLGGRYELGALLGSGGTAQVHRAFDLVLGRSVAVKVFPPHDGLQDDARVEAEGRTLAALSHPGLVAVYDAGSAPIGAATCRYLVMELIDGPNVSVAAYDGSLSPDEVARLAAELGDALAYVHDQGIVHRDIKPANILIAPDRRAKITDFGIARFVDSARQTATGLTIGTAAYLSPEQLTGTEVGPASDVYSLGLVLLECLTLRREYPGTSAEAAFARLHRAPVIPVSLPTPWPRLLAAMTGLDPGSRPSAADVAATFRPRGGVQTRLRPTKEPETAAFVAPAPAWPPARADDTTTPLPVGPAAATAVMPSNPATERLEHPRGTVGEQRRAAPSRRGFGRRPLVAAAAVVALGAASAGVALTAGGTSSPPPSTGSSFSQDLVDLNRAVTP
ncbi:serine/threonine-protein kinase [Acidothermaceae bacterium B102]|nr:serine/threonine-protein kinase [Acidothermaceae bacterium B102]